MGNYNPNQPQVIGNEMTGIRNVDLRPDSSAEHATGLTLSGSTQVGSARFSVNKLNSYGDNAIIYLASVYNKGDIDDSGTIQSCIIPVANVSVTGGTSAPDTGGDYLAAIYNPDTGTLRMTIASGLNMYPLTAAWMRFRTADYAFLANKRILEVNVLANITLNNDTDGNGNIFTPFIGFTNSNSPASILGFTANLLNIFPAIDGQTIDRPNDFVPHPTHRLGTGAIVPIAMSATSLATGERLPWGYTDLSQLGAAGSWFFTVMFGQNFFSTGTINDTATIFYAALEVVYCDEKRVAVGGLNPDVVNNGQWFIQSIPMRAWPAKTANPVLAAGSYDLTITRGEQGYLGPYTDSPDPGINAFRYLSEVPPYNGTELQIPGSLPDAIGQELVATYSTTLPQLTLHATGGPIISDSQGFGQSIAAHVYGVNFARQIVRDPTASGLSYTWIKFWARHMNGTSANLAVNYSGTPLLSLTPAQVDAYPLVADDWHEVTSIIPAVNVATSGTIQWTSASAAANSRWEVIGVASPALTGLPSAGLLTQAPNQNDNATYDGATSFLTWMPNGVTGAFVTAPSGFPGCDASVMLGVAPGAPSGFTVTQRVQHLVGIGLDCLAVPQGIADSLYYNRITWNTPSSSGFPNFGYYELQRQDIVTDWQTIMAATNPAATGFNDYEARPGLQSDYRIRTVTDQGFYGPWSGTVSLTTASPGASGGASFANGHVLLFTSNEAQDGSRNLAYASAWDGASAQVEEQFSFPEAGFVTLQAMYNKDFYTAFRPTERGGEQFQRTILVQAAAIAPETLADFQSMRDLAWASLSYVCVRDEDGNRWFASVTVPEGKVRLNRTIYLATVNVAEVTSTSTQVNP